MQILSTWVLLASAALGALAAEDLKIDVTVPVECDRKTQSGDKVQMHYRGTLAADGKQFDASMSRPASSAPDADLLQRPYAWQLGLRLCL